MPRRLRPDDAIRRFTAVWFGPPGYTLPWRARYSAYLVGGAIFGLILLIEAVTPIPMGVPPTWELAITWVLTTAIMRAVDQDKPLGAVVMNLVNGLRTARTKARDEVITTRPALRSMKITRDPIPLSQNRTADEASSDR